jgi:hypothetical protein
MLAVGGNLFVPPNTPRSRLKFPTEDFLRVIMSRYGRTALTILRPAFF